MEIDLFHQKKISKKKMEIDFDVPKKEKKKKKFMPQMSRTSFIYAGLSIYFN